MPSAGNFIITIIAVTLFTIVAIVYILVNVNPNIYWLIGLVFLAAIAATLIFSIIFFAFGKLRSFETPRDMYRRQIKKAMVVGLLAIALLLAQKFFDLF